MICSKTKVTPELTIIINNGYLEDIVSIIIRNKCNQFVDNAMFSPPKCPVYLRKPWLGNNSTCLIEHIKRSVRRCFFANNLRFVLESNVVFPPNPKDGMPLHLKIF